MGSLKNGPNSIANGHNLRQSWISVMLAALTGASRPLNINYHRDLGHFLHIRIHWSHHLSPKTARKFIRAIHLNWWRSEIVTYSKLMLRYLPERCWTTNDHDFIPCLRTYVSTGAGAQLSLLKRDELCVRKRRRTHIPMQKVVVIHLTSLLILSCWILLWWRCLAQAFNIYLWP